MIFYYSQDGKTEIFASAIGKYFNQNTYKLTSPLNKKSGIGFILVALATAFSGKPGKGSKVDNMPAEVNAPEIYLCAPIWGGNIAAPAKYFLQHAKLHNIKVNLALTATMPSQKYKTNAEKLLKSTQCIPGNVYVFATNSKIIPEEDVLIQQLPELIKTEH